MRCYKCSKFDSGYVKILDMTEVKVGCLRRVLNVKVINENRGRGLGRDHQDYGGECRIILMSRVMERIMNRVSCHTSVCWY